MGQISIWFTIQPTDLNRSWFGSAPLRQSEFGPPTSATSCECETPTTGGFIYSGFGDVTHEPASAVDLGVRTMTIDLVDVLAQHKLWRAGIGGKRANLAGANLAGADLAGADLAGADLAGADLTDTRMSWQSHQLLSELLCRAANDDVEKRQVAGLIRISTDWCWDKFLAIDDPMREWALSVLRPFAADDPDAPEILRTQGGDDVSSVEKT
jgi:hypothetical protein